MEIHMGYVYFGSNDDLEELNYTKIGICENVKNRMDTYKTSSPNCSFNILRFPSFQSIVTLPKHIREERANHIEKWINDNYDGGGNFFLDWERDGMMRLVSYSQGRN